ncbi:hypothetical protein F2Q69_00055565 [Brassica cretica]|uniref:Uncharacterized protein n=1 Tax=Brassica cretica TaxID=69181 RepID=A0A8S9N7J1_BRACR|nr:hypothetical protein F2Q69_00055565 [Brassica cretica]
METLALQIHPVKPLINFINHDLAFNVSFFSVKRCFYGYKKVCFPPLQTIFFIVPIMLILYDFKFGSIPPPCQGGQEHQARWGFFTLTKVNRIRYGLHSIDLSGFFLNRYDRRYAST